MGRKVLTMRSSFKCPFYTGVPITPIQPPLMVQNGTDILTKITKLLCSGMCNNPVRTAPFNGVPQPCVQTLSSWVFGGFDIKKTIKGSPILLNGAMIICPLTGTPVKGKAELTIKAVCGIAAPEIGVSAAPEFAGDSGKQTESAGNSHENQADNENPEEAGKSNIQEENDNNTAQEENNIAQAENENNTVCDEKSQPENPDESTEDEEIQDVPYAVCDYKNCKYAKKCDYLKAPHTLQLKPWSNTERVDTSKFESGAPARILRQNSREKYDEYCRLCESLKRRNNLQWSEQAHHLISNKAVFGQYPELLKIANFYGYDINCSENCIFLPSYDSIDKGIVEAEKKPVRGDDVMEISKMQLHAGQHQYSISISDFDNINPELMGKLKCYNEVVNERFCGEIVTPYTKKSCFYDGGKPDSYKSGAEAFKRSMDSLSREIEQKLSSFSEPKSSYPYFVSLAAMKYAYGMPRSGKLIKVLESSGGWKMVICRFSRYKKYHNEIIITETEKTAFFDGHMNDVEKLILFCENIRLFLVYDEDYIDSEKRFRLPFKTETDIYYITDNGSSLFCGERLIDVRMSADEMERRIRHYAAEELMHDSYIQPQRMIAMRRKECGI